MAALLRPSRAALLLGTLVAAAALVGVGTALPSVAQRTHTFKSYYLSTSEVKDLVPVFVTTDKVLQGTYAQDAIVRLSDGTNLECGGDQGNGLTKCTLKDAWYKRRGTSSYTALPTSCDSFAMKQENGNLVLMVNLQCLGKTIYKEFGEEEPAANRQLAWGGGGSGKGKNYAAKGAAQAAKDDIMDPDMGLYYDPWLPVGLLAWPASCPSVRHLYPVCVLFDRWRRDLIFFKMKKYDMTGWGHSLLARHVCG